MSYLRTSHNILPCFCIDDTIIGRTHAEMRQADNTTQEVLTKLGFTINKDKSILTPTQEQQFLEFRINTLLIR